MSEQAEVDAEEPGTEVAHAPAQQVVGEGPGAIMSAIISMARDPTINVDKFAALVAMQERMEDRQLERESREAEQAYNRDFVAMQGELPRIKRNGRLEYPAKNKSEPAQLISKYATWDNIHAAVMPILGKWGFSMSFKTIVSVESEGRRTGIAVVLRHRAGHVHTGEPFPLPLDTSGGKNNLQAYGSTNSYSKRYAVINELNLSTEDDDDGASFGTLITPEQAEQVRIRLFDAKRDEQQFLSRMFNGEIDRVENIHAANFTIVMNHLQAIIDQQAKRAKSPE